MFGSLFAMIDTVRQMRSRKRIVGQFLAQGFRQLECPTILEILPLRDAGIVREGSNLLFEKGDTQVLVFSTLWTPRCRTPARKCTFTLLCMPLGDDPALRKISAAIREPMEWYSIVDQLDLDSYPTLSPLPDYMIFAADTYSAQQLVTIAGQQRQAVAQTSGNDKPGSLVIHRGRLMLQLSA